MLPKGVKQMLLASEDIYFSEVDTSFFTKAASRETGTKVLQQTPQKQFTENGYAAFSA
jgi:hypothetical protein